MTGNRSKDALIIIQLHEAFNALADGVLLPRQWLIDKQVERNCQSDPISLAQVISDYRALYKDEYFVIPERGKGWRRIKKPDASKQ